MIPLQRLCMLLFICNGELRELLGFLVTSSIFSYMTSNKHETALYTCICVSASRRRWWGLLHLYGFAVIPSAMAVTQVGWQRSITPVQHVSAPKGC